MLNTIGIFLVIERPVLSLLYQIKCVGNTYACTKTFHMKMSLVFMKISLQVKHIFVRMVLHEDSF